MTPKMTTKQFVLVMQSLPLERFSVIFHDSILIYNSKFALTLSDCDVSMLHVLLPCFVVTFTKFHPPNVPPKPQAISMNSFSVF